MSHSQKEYMDFIKIMVNGLFIAIAAFSVSTKCRAQWAASSGSGTPVTTGSTPFAPVIASGSTQSTVTLDVDDISWLFPPPHTVQDVEKLISMDTLLSGTTGNLVWPAEAFKTLLAIADSKAASVQGTNQITLPPEVRDQSVWRIAAFRIDPSAPGTSSDIISQFGSAPQIRLILQPVTISGSTVDVHDIAVHVLYTFFKGVDASDPTAFPKIIADRDQFSQIVTDLVALKKLCSDAGVNTTGVPLGIHPGLAQPDKVPNLLPQLRAFLSKHLDNPHLTGMALMALPNKFEPWIFVAIPRDAKTGAFFPLPSPGLADPTLTAEMLAMLPSPHVMAPPAPNNRNPIINKLFVPPSQRRGVSTAVLFQPGVVLSAPAVSGTTSSGENGTDSKALNRDIPDIIANPNLTHFFSADCISCHTETTRREILFIPPGDFAFKPANGISGLDESVRPTKVWDLRNFGWFHSNFGVPDAVATATQRTANETAAAVDFINRTYLNAPVK